MTILPTYLSKPARRFLKMCLAAVFAIGLAVFLCISCAYGAEKSAASASASGVAAVRAAVPKKPATLSPKEEAPSPIAESNWKALERIDDKMANTVVLMTGFIALLVVVVGIYEVVKLNELEKLREGFEKNMAEMALQHEKSIETKFVERFSNMFETYKLDLNHRLLSYLNEKTSNLSQRHLKRSNVFHRVLLCYAYNELTEHDTDALLSAHVAAFIEFQRALVQIISGQTDDVATGLNYIRDIAENSSLSEATATQLIPFLMLVKDDLVMQHFSVAQSWNELVQILEAKTHTRRDDPVFADFTPRGEPLDRKA